MKNLQLNPIQKAAWSLMRNDLQFLYTIIKNQNVATASYYVALIPFMGLIIDGVEDWIKAYNNSSKNKLLLPTFNDTERMYYEEMRNSIKLYDKSYAELYVQLEDAFIKSDKYFSSCCKPIAKRMRLYDVYGVFTCNSIPCDNTLLNQCVTPFFEYGKIDGEEIKRIAHIGGEYIALFDSCYDYKVDTTFMFDTTDYGGFIKSPFGKKFNYKYVLFSILCQINFVLTGINRFVTEETTTKLRFSYILYFYLLKIIPDINNEINLSLKMDDTYNSDGFRNAMAHYKLGVALKETEIINDAYMYGLTEKFFGIDYQYLKADILQELENLKKQITDLL